MAYNCKQLSILHERHNTRKKFLQMKKKKKCDDTNDDIIYCNGDCCTA